MAQPATKSVNKQEKQNKKAPAPLSSTPLLFARRNYLIMLGGIVLMAIGYLLMSGGSQPPDQFDPKVIYGFTRITLSSILVIGGFIVVLFSIFAKTKPSQS